MNSDHSLNLVDTLKIFFPGEAACKIRFLLTYYSPGHLCLGHSPVHNPDCRSVPLLLLLGSSLSGPYPFLLVKKKKKKKNNSVSSGFGRSCSIGSSHVCAKVCLCKAFWAKGVEAYGSLCKLKQDLFTYFHEWGCLCLVSALQCRAGAQQSAL